MNATRIALALGGRRQPRPRAAPSPRAIAARVAPPLCLGLAVVLLWQGYVELSGVRESIFPSPLEVARALGRERGVLASAAWTTLLEILLGYAAAIVVGVAFAVAVSSSRLIERALYPWLVVTQMIPIVAIAPVVVLWTGFDIRPRVIVIALVSFFPIAVNTIDGLRATDAELLGLLRTLGASRRQLFRVAQVPTALPVLLLGAARVGRAGGDRRRLRRVGGILERPRLSDPQLQLADRDRGGVRDDRGACGDRRRAVCPGRNS